MAAADFTPFPVPRTAEDKPLFTHNGFDYKCTGCGGPIPDGAWITEDVEGGMVVGLLVRKGQDGPVVHACGSRAGG